MMMEMIMKAMMVMRIMNIMEEIQTLMVLTILDNFTIQVEEPLPVYRRALANAEDGSVAIASVSFS